jgi:MFS family permease
MNSSESLPIDTTTRTEALQISRNVKALGWVSFLTDVHSESILPLLPLFITQVLGLNQTFLGLIEGIAESTASFLKVFSGWYSDRVRRRKAPTAAGYLLSTVVKPFLAVSRTGGAVLFIRFIDRVGKGIRTAPRDALIADSSSSLILGRAYGFHRMMDTLGAVGGTIFCYLLFRGLRGDDGSRMRTIFLLSTIFGVAAFVVLLLFVRERRQSPASSPSQSSLFQFPPLHGRLLMFIGINVIFYLGMFSYAFFLLRARSLGITTKQIPLIYLLYNIVYALVALPVGSLSDRIGRKPIILASYFLYAALCIWAAFAAHWWEAWLLFCIYGIHSATVNPASRALVAELSRMEARGTALGIYHASVGIAALPASLAAGILWDRFTPGTPFLVAGILALSAFFLVLPLSLKASR